MLMYHLHMRGVQGWEKKSPLQTVWISSWPISSTSNERLASAAKNQFQNREFMQPFNYHDPVQCTYVVVSGDASWWCTRKGSVSSPPCPSVDVELCVTSMPPWLFRPTHLSKSYRSVDDTARHPKGSQTRKGQLLFRIPSLAKYKFTHEKKLQLIPSTIYLQMEEKPVRFQ